MTYRTANLQSCILYIYSTNIGTEYFKHGTYSPFFFSSSKCSLFYNSNVFGSCFIHILYTGCAKIKKHNSGAKRLTLCGLNFVYMIFESYKYNIIHNIFDYKNGLSPGGSGYFTCIQNMKLVTNKFKSGGLHEKHVVATWNVGNHLSICF